MFTKHCLTHSPCGQSNVSKTPSKKILASEYGKMMEYGLGTYGGDCVDTIRKGFNK
jgi:hypothetical protein